MAKKLIKLLVILIIFNFLPGCNLNPFKNNSSSSSQSNTIRSFSIKYVNVYPSHISRSIAGNVTFSWNVDYTCPDNFYYLDIYLSRDNTLDPNDTLIYHKVCTSSNGSIELSTNDAPMINVYGGKYYVLFGFRCGSETPIVKSFSNFTIKTKWTFMVYMDGDNDLDLYTTYDLNEMEEIGSSKNVNIIVEKDDYGPAGRYFIKPDSIDLLQNLGEVDMGDNKTLTDFVFWTLNNFPADHYVLVLWNHGGGFKRSFSGSAPILKDICIDQSSNDDTLTMPELRGSLSAIYKKLGHKIDIIGMDACLMGMIEVAYDIKNFADFMVASENTEPADGWPYNKILWILVNNPDITPKNFAKKIVEEFISSYSSSDEATQSAIDLSQIGNLTSAIDKLAKCLISEFNNNSYTLINTFQNNIFPVIQRFDDLDPYGIGPEDSYVDLYDLAYLINQNVSNCSLEAESLMNIFNSTVIASNNTGFPVKDAYGLSIWLPPDSLTYQDYLSYYNRLLFVNATSWEDFLKDLWNQ